MQQCNTAALNNSEILRGRVLLAMIFRYYAHGNSGQVLYDMNHLQTLTLQGDQLEAFHNTWNIVLSELATVPSDELLQFWYFKQIEKFRPLAEDVAHYK